MPLGNDCFSRYGFSRWDIGLNLTVCSPLSLSKSVAETHDAELGQHCECYLHQGAHFSAHLRSYQDICVIWTFLLPGLMQIRICIRMVPSNWGRSKQPNTAPSLERMCKGISWRDGSLDCGWKGQAAAANPREDCTSVLTAVWLWWKRWCGTWWWCTRWGRWQRWVSGAGSWNRFNTLMQHSTKWFSLSTFNRYIKKRKQQDYVLHIYVGRNKRLGISSYCVYRPWHVRSKTPQHKRESPERLWFSQKLRLVTVCNCHSCIKDSIIGIFMPCHVNTLACWLRLDSSPPRYIDCVV